MDEEVWRSLGVEILPRLEVETEDDAATKGATGAEVTTPPYKPPPVTCWTAMVTPAPLLPRVAGLLAGRRMRFRRAVAPHGLVAARGGLTVAVTSRILPDGRYATLFRRLSGDCLEFATEYRRLFEEVSDEAQPFVAKSFMSRPRA